MSYTPGPWATHKTEGNGGNISDRLEIVGPEEGRKRTLIASIYGFKMPEGQANARLIAAAPELYEALEKLFDLMISDKVRNNEGVRRLQMAADVLAKARREEGRDG